MSVDFNRLREVFLEAVERHSPDGWPTFLDQACGSDRDLRSRVEALLRAHIESEPYSGHVGPDPPPEDVARRPLDWVGKSIGPYKLIEPIGDGGMGTVFMAEQTRPIQRIVALKVIKPGMDSRQVIARFEAERQALALMDHPNIARVLDAGTTDSGQPYFVMELIKGVPITRFCDDRHLTPRQRLELCIPVCQAIQHAHQKGIIHRDVKPSNVLIALYDGKPVPKVIDFGVAKAIRQPLTERTLFTGFGAIIGTLEYMSPEQAELNQLDIDSRSDIYGLGVLLYELLTGTTPIQHERIKRAGNLEVLRLIREEEPPTPSTRLETTDELAAIAANRGLEPRRLSGLVRGELDWIVMKCLEKERGRRYVTADGLARDLERYLADEPIEACPPSAYYRLSKFASKYRRSLTTMTLFLLLLIAGIIATTWLALRATKAEAQAREQAEIAQQINSFLQNDLLAGASPESSPDRDLKLRTVLDKASQRVQDGFKDRPLVEAGLHQTLGIAFLSLGEYAPAEQHLRRATDLYQQLRGPRHRDTLAATGNLAIVYFRQGRLDEARKLHETNLATLRTTLGPESAETVKSISGLANVLIAQGHMEESRKLLEETLPMVKKALGADNPLTHSTMLNLARVYTGLGRFDDARRLDEEVLPLIRRKFGDEHPRTLVAMNNLASVLKQQGHLDEARPLYVDALQIKRRTLGAEHPSTLVALYNLADLDLAAGQFEDARTLYEQALAAQKRVLGTKHSDTLRSMVGLASVLRRQGRLKEARALYEETLSIQRTALGPDHPDTIRTKNLLADSFLDEGRVDEARRLYDEVLSERLRVLGPKHPDTLRLIKNLAWYLVTSPQIGFRDPGRAMALARDALTQTPDDGDVWNTIGVAQYRSGNWQDAVASLGKSMELRRGGDSRDYFFLAMSHWRLKDHEQAQSWYDRAVDWMEKNESKSDELQRFRTEAEQLLSSRAR